MKDNQPTLAARIVSEPWMEKRPNAVEQNRGHGRIEKRTVRVLPVPEDAPLAGFPSARQMIMITRERTTLQGTSLGALEVAFAITDLSRQQASPRDLAQMVRGHWCIENGLHWVRDVTYGEDHSRVRTGSGPRVMASLRNLAISIHRLDGEKNMRHATRACCQNSRRAFALLAGRTTPKPQLACA